MQQKTITTEPDHSKSGFTKKAVAVSVIAAAIGLGICSSTPTPAYGETQIMVSADTADRPLSVTNNILKTKLEKSSEASIMLVSASTAEIEVPAPAPEPEPEPVSIPAPGIGAQALAVAYSYIGVPYVANAASPDGFDCSGLVMFSFAQVGVSVPHGADQIAYMGTVIDASQAVPGDLVWYPNQHIGFWVAPGQMLDAPIPGRTVDVHDIWGDPLIVRL